MWAMMAILACSSKDTPPPPAPPLDPAIVGQIDPHRIKAHVDVLADDDTGGRIPGSEGGRAARDYIEGEIVELGLEPLGTDGYVFAYPNEPTSGRFQREPDGSIVENRTDTGHDLVALLPGSDPALSDEYIVVMAHHDHLGVTEDGEVFNGAFDNAVAVGLALELARVLIAHDAQPGRSIVFLFTDDEEAGLDGAEAWIHEATVPFDDIVFAVSLDPLGRRMLPDYDPIVLIGLERSPALEARWREAAAFVDSPVYFINRDVIPVFASDQDEFYNDDIGIPAVWFTNIGFAYYHTVDDTPDTIDYRMVLDDAALVAQALTVIGNDDQRYPFIGAQEPAGAAAAEAKRLFDDMLASRYPSQSDRDLAAFYTDQLDEVIAADDQAVIDNPTVLYTAALYFLLFDMSAKYAGEIPPPWPEGW